MINSVQCVFTVCIVQCTVCIVQCTVCIVQCTVCIIQCVLYSVQCVLYSSHLPAIGQSHRGGNGSRMDWGLISAIMYYATANSV